MNRLALLTTLTLYNQLTTAMSCTLANTVGERRLSPLVDSYSVSWPSNHEASLQAYAQEVMAGASGLLNWTT